MRIRLAVDKTSFSMLRVKTYQDQPMITLVISVSLHHQLRGGIQSQQPPMERLLPRISFRESTTNFSQWITGNVRGSFQGYSQNSSSDMDKMQPLEKKPCYTLGRCRRFER